MASENGSQRATNRLSGSDQSKMTPISALHRIATWLLQTETAYNDILCLFISRFVAPVRLLPVGALIAHIFISASINLLNASFRFFVAPRVQTC